MLPTYLIRNGVLLIAVIFMGLLAEDCPADWFGENCMYKCHCSGTQTCQQNGDCGAGVACSRSYFGPGCQYLELLQHYGTSGGYLSDRNTSTCSSDNLTSLSVSLSQSIPFTWLRITTKTKIDQLSFTFYLGDNEKCKNEKRYILSDKVMDVSCDQGALVNKFIFNGTIAGAVCSLDVSGGRNVALKQMANQSSDRRNDSYKGYASHAVDGDTANIYSTTNSCTHTGEELEPWWYLKYNRPQVIQSVVLYNRDAVQSRLEGFVFRTYNEHGEVVHFDNTTSNTARSTYSMNFVNFRPITSVHIFTPKFDVLTLCEVLTYGETVCPERKYGLYCSESCKCTDTQTCSPVTGLCAEGCSKGTYGYQCQDKCSTSCVNNTCFTRTGQCFSCPAGKMGPMCDVACGNGTFGYGCASTCSVYCTASCDKISGACDCKPGHVGKLCTECPVGKFDKDCSKSCPEGCSTATCNITTGVCLTCNGDGSPPECEESSFLALYIVIVLLVILLLAALLFLLFRRRKSGGAAME